MQDGVIKGTGNSRYLKSIAAFLTQYPTYEAFAAALAAGTLPIDLNGINETGWETLGTALNKANLLQDATAALYGLDNTAVVDDAFEKIKELIDSNTALANSKVQMQTGSYIGSGTYGANNPTILTFGFAPIILILFDDWGKPALGTYGNWASPAYVPAIGNPTLLTTEYQYNALFVSQHYDNRYRYITAKKSTDGKTVYWYNDFIANAQFNDLNTTYHYIALK